MRENSIEKHFVRRFEQIGAEVRKLKWVGHRGAPDRIVMFRGVTIFAELKTTGKKPESHQQKEISKMKAVGQEVHVIDSTTQVDELIASTLLLKDIR